MLKWVHSCHAVVGRPVEPVGAKSRKGDEFCEWRICMNEPMCLYSSTTARKDQGNPTAGSGFRTVLKPGQELAGTV